MSSAYWTMNLRSQFHYARWCLGLFQYMGQETIRRMSKILVESHQFLLGLLFLITIIVLGNVLHDFCHGWESWIV